MTALDETRDRVPSERCESGSEAVRMNDTRQHDSNSETAEEARGRWCRLYTHLCDHGLKKVPDDCLEKPKKHTRPGRQLVAYFPRVKHKPVGQTAEFLTRPLTVALFSLLWGLFTNIQAMRNFNLISIGDIFAILFYVMVTAALVIYFTWLRLKLHSVNDPFYLDLKELSLGLPTGSRHVQWKDVYSVSSDPNKPDQLRVELQDGMTTLVHLKAQDRKLLEKIMVKLIRIHQQGAEADQCVKGANTMEGSKVQ